MKNTSTNLHPLAVLCSLVIISMAFFSTPSSTTHRSKPLDKKKSEVNSESLGALAFETQMVNYPNSDLPPAAYAKAYDYYRQQFLNNNKKISSNANWQTIGPTNITGRTIAIAIDPVDTGVIWVGAAGGGLWKSTTGGIGPNAWTNVPIGFPVVGVSSIAINPNNHNEMFIGTGEVYYYQQAVGGLAIRTTRGSYGMGIFKSTDGGSTWTQSLNWSYQQQRGIWDIVINPKNSNTIYAATTEGVYKSLDDGGTWNLSLNEQMVMDLEMDPSDTSILYAGVGDQDTASKAGVYKTSTAGSLWTQVLAQGNTGRTTISIYPKNPNIVMAFLGNALSTNGIYKSINKGKTWKAAMTTFTDISSYQGWYAKALLMKPDDSSTVVAAGVNFYKSTDAGSSFTQTNDINNQFLPHDDYHGLITNPKDVNKLYAITDGGLFRSNQFGSISTFYSCNDGMVTTQFYKGDAAFDDSSLVFGGLQDNSSAQYMGSPAWTFYDNFGDGTDGSYDNSDHNNIVGSTDGLYLQVSYDDGLDWLGSYVYNFPPVQPAFFSPLVRCPSDPNTVYSCNGGLYQSSDGGYDFYLDSNFTPLSPPIAVAVSQHSVDTFYIATSPIDDFGNVYGMSFYRSFDGGNTFTDVTGTLPDRYPRSIAVDPNNSKIVYVTFSGFGTGHVFQSNDAGNTWTDLSSSLPDLPVNTILVDPLVPTTLYIGTDFNVFVSQDDGKTWNDYSLNLPQATQVYELVNSAKDRKIVAFTHGHGVFKGNYVDVPSGINPIPSVTFIQGYPNPSDQFYKLKLNDLANGSELSVFNSNGQLVLQHIMASPDETINTSSFIDGIYYLEISNASTQKFASRFVVMH